MSTKNTKKLTIIIVSYNTRMLLKECLEAVIASEGFDNSWEVFVVDNGSTDGSVGMASKILPAANVISLNENLGFAKANNIAIRKSQGAYVLLLNSDTEVSPTAIQRVIDYMDSHVDASVVTGKLLLTNGSLDPACHRGFPTPWAAFTYFSGLERLFSRSRFLSGYHMGFKDITEAHEIDCPSGAFFCVRKEVIDEVGLLDEAFFMYGEDVDWAYRIKSRGYKILFFPDALITHKKKKSGMDTKDLTVKIATQRSFITTMKLFYVKHYEKKYPWIVTHMVYASLWFRLMVVTYLHI